MRSLAVIPARGGSKRIPRKNIKEFLGHPVMWYPIQASLKVFDKTVVSTEDKEIKQVALECGAEVVDRPREFADDFTPTGIVTAETAKLFPDYDLVACIYPTAVFVTPQLLREAMERLGDADCIFPMVRYSHPIQRALKIEGGLVKFANPEFRNVRTQDCSPRYNDAGQFYIMHREPLIEHRNIYFERMVPLILSESQVQDMDTLDDWKIAEIKYEMQHGGGVERR